MQDFLGALKPMFDLKPLERVSNPSSSSVNHSVYYTHIFGFETQFQSREYVESWGAWMARNWVYSIHLALAYCVLVFAGRWLMRDRAKFDMRLPLIMWNVFLAAFSLLGSVRVLPEFVDALMNHGVKYSVCNREYAYGITGFWALMFILSKLPELVDTLFIVLRKQELIFLHWYHHATVLVYCWFSYSEFAATGRWFMTMNYMVHGLMYSYYACKAMRVRVPHFIAGIITTCQILQMIVGCYVNFVAWHTRKYEPTYACHISDDNIKWSFLMYLSYFALFANFFLNAYVFKTKAAKTSGVATATAAKQQNGQLKKLAKKTN